MINTVFLQARLCLASYCSRSTGGGRPVVVTRLMQLMHAGAAGGSWSGATALLVLPLLNAVACR